MGIAAEHCSKKYQITREQQDDFAIASYKRAQTATANSHFLEIEPIEIPGGRGKPAIIVKDDEDAKNVTKRIERELIIVERVQIEEYSTGVCRGWDCYCP